jgi:hypothetical protein
MEDCKQRPHSQDVAGLCRVLCCVLFVCAPRYHRRAHLPLLEHVAEDRVIELGQRGQVVHFPRLSHLQSTSTPRSDRVLYECNRRPCPHDSERVTVGSTATLDQTSTTIRLALHRRHRKLEWCDVAGTLGNGWPRCKSSRSAGCTSCREGGRERERDTRRASTEVAG